MLMEDFGYPKKSGLNLILRNVEKKINKCWRKSKKVFNYEYFLKMYHSYWDGRRLEVLHDSIDGKNLQELIGKCKANQVTVNSAIAAAFLAASENEDEVGMAVNVRPDGYEGMGNFASGISVQYEWDRGKTYWRNAASLHRLIHKKLSSNKEKYFVLQFLKGMEPTLIDATYFYLFGGFQNEPAAKVAEWFGYKPNGQVALGISNLTKPPIPVSYGKYSIERVEFIPPLLPNNKYVIGIVTVADQMTVTMQFEIGKNYDKIESIFAQAMNILKNPI